MAAPRRQGRWPAFLAFPPDLVRRPAWPDRSRIAPPASRAYRTPIPSRTWTSLPARRERPHLTLARVRRPALSPQRRTEVVAHLATLPQIVEAIRSGPGNMPHFSEGNITNTEALGRVLYTQYVYFFQVAGLVLLVAMVGAIVLTLRHKPNVKRQNIADQVARTKATAIEIRQVRPGQGI